MRSVCYNLTDTAYLTSTMLESQPNASARELFIAAHYPNQEWHPLARMVRPEGGPGGPYVLTYTNGVEKSYFGLPEMLRPQQGHYPDIPSIISSRLMPSSRPDYRAWLSWMDLEGDPDPFDILARTGGRKATDYFETFLKPEPVQGKCQAYFFLHGMRYFPVDRIGSAIRDLCTDDRLLTMSDFENSHDSNAVALRTDNSTRQILGYCPGYIAYNFRKLLMEPAKHNLMVRVQKINRDAPLRMQLLCQISFDWPKDFDPFASRDFQLLGSG